MHRLLWIISGFFFHKCWGFSSFSFNTRWVSNPSRTALLQSKGFSSKPDPKKTTSKFSSNDKQQNLNDRIQQRIDQIADLRTVMKLYDEIHSETLLQTKLPSFAYSNSDQLSTLLKEQQRYESLGWSRTKVQEWLQQVTWDCAAQERHQRHETQSHLISSKMEEFMLQVANWTLRNDHDHDSSSVDSNHPNVILDVGCGTGIFLKYLLQYLKALSKPSSSSSSTAATSSISMTNTFSMKDYHGVDLSSSDSNCETIISSC
jgi:hypothetical protein